MSCSTAAADRRIVTNNLDAARMSLIPDIGPQRADRLFADRVIDCAACGGQGEERHRNQVFPCLKCSNGTWSVCARWMYACKGPSQRRGCEHGREGVEREGGEAGPETRRRGRGRHVFVLSVIAAVRRHARGMAYLLSDEPGAGLERCSFLRRVAHFAAALAAELRELTAALVAAEEQSKELLATSLRLERGATQRRRTPPA